MRKLVPLSKYCELSGEKRKAVERRIERGIWAYGEQVLKIKGVRERWIDLAAVEAWVRQNTMH
ncbi:hypothetical protein [Pseudoalteromonas sp. T1lg48]|uniref:hypothetical protein n=1 Tax=Pseudoalteromonas sp. T1lg48 TaxID=2077100 RepID=UPI000CF690D0|nr:hypothetical protein [Pseudoalteromonas sp. T1lg48]